MPFRNRFDPKKLLRSRQLEEKSLKDGLRQGIFNGVYDKYTGDWKRDKKTGKGAMLTKKMVLYEGDFLNDYRHGAGVLAYYLPEYKVFRLIYRGDWKYGRMHGEGMRSYPEGFYVGSFQHGKRQGLGQMYYNDGSYYDGEWVKDQREGIGMLVLPNGNRYEGSWLQDQKHGKARLYFLNVGQIQIGVWRLGVCLFSTITNLPFRQAALAPTFYPLPVNCLENLDRFCDRGESLLLNDNERSADILVQYHYAGSPANVLNDEVSLASTRLTDWGEIGGTDSRYNISVQEDSIFKK